MGSENVESIKIFIADDHPLVRKTLRRLLEEEQDLTVVGEASDAVSLRKKLDDTEVNVIITDLAMLGHEGVGLISSIRKDHPSVAVIVLSLHPEERFAALAMTAGAAGYLTKDTPPEIITNAIRLVALGRHHVTSSLATRIHAEPHNPNEHGN